MKTPTGPEAPPGPKANRHSIDAVSAATYDKAIKKLKGAKKEDMRRFLSKEMSYEEQVFYVKHLNAELINLNELHEWYRTCIETCVGKRAAEQRKDARDKLKRVKKKQAKLHESLDKGL
jgi:hypothetical protein